jgi:predicted dehydrogenase
MSGSKSDVVRIGSVGCGVVASAYYLPFILDYENTELVAVCDSREDRARECARLFGAPEIYTDYSEMIARSDIDAVLILTGPGTHARFALEAIDAGRHLLLQKPMALTFEDADAITKAVRNAGLKAVVEPSSGTVLHPRMAKVKEIVDAGALGDPYWFYHVPTGPTSYHPSLSGNPYGAGAFYTKDSGGMIFDYPYGPTEIVSVLGSIASILGSAKISVPDRAIVPEEKYDEFLSSVEDPHEANYWPTVINEERTQPVKMEAPDNAFCTYEMANGAIGVYHVGRLFHPMPKGVVQPGLQIFGTEGNVIFGGPHTVSIISSRTGVLPETDDDGWYHIDEKPTGPSRWPIPAPGMFNYYHESTRHLVECILNDTDPVVNVEWGRHITEIMYGVVQSDRTGTRYRMKSTTTGLVD